MTSGFGTILRRTLLIIFVSVVIVFVCVLRSDDFVAVIRNNSSFLMSDVEVNGDDQWSQPVPDIPPGDKVRVLVTQHFVESGLGIRFIANGTEVTKGEVAYVMYGGRGTTATFTILEDLNVTATYSLFPSWLLLQ